MKLIHDSVHGTIRLKDWMVEIIDTPEFQRLRRIKQLGFANLVYPGANHTRFEHSIGTAFVAERIAGDEEIIASALIHDLGHTPFSHSGEAVLRRYVGIRHEDLKEIVRESEVRDVLERNGFSWKKVVEKANKPPVSSVIDADRIDYLLRDAHYTGVAYGIVDFDRLVEKISYDGDEVYVDISGVRAVESFLISRYLMYSAVYHHHVCRIARRMFEKALEWMIERDLLNARDLVKMDDHDVFSIMRNSEGFPREIGERLSMRRLYKRALYAGIEEVGVNLSRINQRKAEIEIAEMAGVDDGKVIVDILPPESEEYSIPVKHGNDVFPIEKISPLVKSLKEAQALNWRLGVYCPPELVEKVRKGAIDFFNIRVSEQKRLSDLFEF